MFNRKYKEIINNKIQNTIKIRSEIQKFESNDEIYVTDNFKISFRRIIKLRKKNINKGDKEVRKYECQCEPNLEKCSKNCFYNYIK